MSLPQLVSVIIPTFNRAHLLPKAIESVQNQTYPNIQIIVVDDGSTDETEKMVLAFEGVEYYYQENKRQGAARNLGLSKAKGEIIASLDSDDAWHESFISESIACLEYNDLDFVFSDWTYQIDSVESRSGWYNSRLWEKYQNSAFQQWFLLNSAEVRRLFIETCPAPSSALVIKRSSLPTKWCEEMLIADDWCLVLDMVLAKNCWAAFTLKPSWWKGVHDQNIYDGRERIEITKKLGLHDENLLAKRFATKLSPSEKKIFRNRMAEYHFNLGFWDFKENGITKKGLKSLINSWLVTPIGFFLVILSHLNYKMRKHFSANPLSASEPDALTD